MFCGNCGAKNDDGARFCSKCGNPLSSVPQGTMKISREKNFGYAVATFKVRIDNSDVYQLKNGQSVSVPIDEGVHVAEMAIYGDYQDKIEFSYPETKEIFIKQAKLFAVDPGPSKTFMQGLSDLAKSATESVQKVAQDAVTPVALNIPAGGVPEPNGYDKIGSHIEIAAEPSFGTVDAKRPYIFIIIDDAHVYSLQDGQKINIPVPNGHHTIEFKRGNSSDSIDIDLSEIAYIKIHGTVSMKVIVQRSLVVCYAKEELHGSYDKSILASDWEDVNMMAYPDYRLTKNQITVVYEDKIVVKNEDGTDTSFDFHDLYKIVQNTTNDVTIIDLEKKNQIVSIKLPDEALSIINQSIENINNENEKYIKLKERDDEIAHNEETYNKKFGEDDVIQISEELGKFRIVPRGKMPLPAHNINSIISYEMHEIVPTQKNVAAEAIIGTRIAGTAAGWMSAVNAQNDNKKITSFQVWITIRTSGDIKVLKVAFGDSPFNRGGQKHENCLSEYKRFDSYMKTRAVPTTNSDEKKITESAVNTVEEIRKYKQLLDEGIITEEEFSDIKKNLIGGVGIDTKPETNVIVEDSEEQEIESYIRENFANDIVKATKYYREVTGLGLKESKDAVVSILSH